MKRGNVSGVLTSLISGAPVTPGLCFGEFQTTKQWLASAHSEKLLFDTFCTIEDEYASGDKSAFHSANNITTITTEGPLCFQ